MLNQLIRSIFILALTITLITGCRNSTNKDEGMKDILRTNIDSSVSPAKDFFNYANGSWIKKNLIPASESQWGIANLVQEETYARLRKISEDAAKNKSAKEGTALQKIGDFFYTGMDSLTIEKNGVKPLKPEFDRIHSITNTKELLDEVARLHKFLMQPMFDLTVYQDMKNSNKMALYITQGGLGLPNRDYYFNKDLRTSKIRKEYVLHIAKMMVLMGEDPKTAKKHADRIMSIETGLASKSRKLEDLRDPYHNYNKMTLEEINKLSPSINWKVMLTSIGARNLDTVIVGQPEFLTEVEHSLKTVTLEDWKSYLKWHFVSSYAGKLSRDFDLEHFHFYGTILDGKQKQRVRWKRVLDAEEEGMGELLGQLYVSNYFPEKTRKRYETLVNNVLEAYSDRIKKLDWMSGETKEKALDKLSKVIKKVGYPDKWKDYSSLVIDRDSYVMNAMRTRNWEFNYQLEKLVKPVDRTEWDMTPQTYNAYYNPSNNEIVLPAAIFIIPGLADSLADDAIIYSYAGGSTIGHEITHGFDDEGRQFDAQGNLHNWWTKEDEQKFNEKTKLMVDQFSSYVVLDNIHVNGKASLGENIADLAGVILGYEAFLKTDQAKEGKMIAGLTPNQHYFLAYALSWLGHQRDEKLAQQIMTDVHAPAFLRVNGPLSDIPEFLEAFNIKPGDPMYRPDSLRVRIW
ncbi:MAG: M13 family metallopeptidase [Bacteroidetes bacterium]|nr:M13 family metallopeptidase [Bacteroidota bacterium]